MTLATAATLPPNPPAARQAAPVAKPAAGLRLYEIADDYPATGAPDFARLADFKRADGDLAGEYGEFVIAAKADANGDAKRAEAGDFCGPAGGLALVSGVDLPADLLARALAAAYLVLREGASDRLNY